MRELLTAEQMKALERSAMERGEATGLDLMERAGRGVVDAALREWPDLAEGAHRAIVLCGPGNNGGDGFVIARRLQARGWEVDVWLFGDVVRLPPDARRNHEIWSTMGGIRGWEAGDILAGPRPDLIVDAVFGIGLTRPLPDAVADVLHRRPPPHWLKGDALRMVTVDCPSGLDLDTGMVPGLAASDIEDLYDPQHMDRLTVTFHCGKPGHFIGHGPRVCQKLHLVDIGLSGDAERGELNQSSPAQGRVRFVSADTGLRAQASPTWPLSLLSKMKHGGHKFDHGHVMVFAGGVGRGGAGRLAARAALRSGAGLVTLLCPPAALQENACHLDAIMLRAIRNPEALDAVADGRVSSFCLGPGMGVSQETRDMVRAVLARRADSLDERNPAVVLDADALSSFAERPEDLFAATHDRVVLTPHEGEFARLFPDLAQARRGARSKIDVVREAAARAGCVILLKGADTVIATPDGTASVHAAVYERDAPWLATAGAGDVLAGLVAGLAAPRSSVELNRMAEVATWLHVECARAFGPGLIAEDLPDQLPKVLRALQG